MGRERTIGHANKRDGKGLIVEEGNKVTEHLGLGRL
jgi:hypothetical protein